MLLSLIGFLIVFLTLCRLIWALGSYLVSTFYNLEERLAGKQILQRIDDVDVNNTIIDGLAAFAPGHSHLIAGAAAAAFAILALPFFHWLYALWVRFLMLFSDSMDEGSRIFAVSINTIQDYMPRILVNALALALLGAFYAAKRRKYQRKDAVINLLLFKITSTELLGMSLGWFIYMMSATLPRFSSGSSYNFAGMLSLSGGWIWVLSGILIGMYLHSSENFILWTLYRYNWSAALPAVVRMMAVRRLDLPANTIQKVEVDEPAGAATIHAHVDPIDADRLRDSLLAIPGLHRPKVIALGPLPDAPVRIATQLAPRMKPLPPRAFRRVQGPPKGYNAEADLLDADSTITATSAAAGVAGAANATASAASATAGAANATASAAGAVGAVPAKPAKWLDGIDAALLRSPG